MPLRGILVLVLIGSKIVRRDCQYPRTSSCEASNFRSGDFSLVAFLCTWPFLKQNQSDQPSPFTVCASSDGAIWRKLVQCSVI